VNTGKLKWYFQFTPHDLHDWDATQTPLLADITFRGRPRKVLMQANRNGFFYVLDRITGEFLLAQPFVRKLTWAKAIAPNGRPELIPGNDPTPEGVRTCPSVEGATNWMSTAFHPGTNLFYVMALEACTIYTKSDAWWEPGKSFYGGGTRQVPGESRQKVLRAIDPGNRKDRVGVRAGGPRRHVGRRTLNGWRTGVPGRRQWRVLRR
jgi:alcohol dehydrogenase (cytochrome c)